MNQEMSETNKQTQIPPTPVKTNKQTKPQTPSHQPTKKLKEERVWFKKTIGSFWQVKHLSIFLVSLRIKGGTKQDTEQDHISYSSGI